MRKLKEITKDAKEMVSEEFEGLKDFAMESPFLFGRYYFFEVSFAIVFVYCIVTGKRIVFYKEDKI